MVAGPGHAGRGAAGVGRGGGTAQEINHFVLVPVIVQS